MDFVLPVQLPNFKFAKLGLLFGTYGMVSGAMALGEFTPLSYSDFVIGYHVRPLSLDAIYVDPGCEMP